MKITFLDLNPSVTDALAEAFAGIENVVVKNGKYDSVPAGAIVSAANSFGIMDGGLDDVLTSALPMDTEQRLQCNILDHYHGELPVGSAIALQLFHQTWNCLIAAPTMRVPMDVSNTLNAYHAMRAILIQARELGVRSIVIPGLCTGYGKMNPRKAAGQMRAAYGSLTRPARIPSFAQIHDEHRRLELAN